MRSGRKLGRRSFLARVVGGAGAAAFGAPALAYQVSDSDPTDPIGHGRGGGTGITDHDSGPGADPAGRGRGGGAAHPQGQGGVTDSDPTDPIGRGRGSGGNAGRRDTPNRDSGSCADYRRELDALNETLSQYPFNWTDDDLWRARSDLRRVQGKLAEIDADLARTQDVRARQEIIWDGGEEILDAVRRWDPRADSGMGGCSRNQPHNCVRSLESIVRHAESQQPQKGALEWRVRTLQDTISRECG